MINRRARRLAAGAALAALVTLSGCGGSGGGEEGGSTLRVAPSVPVVSLDPQGEQSADDGNMTVFQHVYDALVRREGEKFVPMLAESWENPDERTWVFKLRSGVKFHDGTPFTAADVKASLERLVEKKGPLSPLFDALDTVEATGDATVTIKTKDPLGTMLSNLALVYIAPASHLADDSFWRAPAGTGAFKVTEFVPDEKVVLTGNKEYWGGAPKLDRLEFNWIPEIAARLTALETGEIDVTWNIAPDQVSSIRGNSEIAYETADSFTYYFNWFNSSRKPFDDPRVRRAMWYALDVNSAVRDLFGDMATVAKAPIPQEVFGAASLTPYPYDPAKARELLAEAGYPDGFETTLQWPRESGANIRSLATKFISDWAKAGVKVAPMEKERAQWIEDLNGLKWDMNLQTNSSNTGDADYVLGRLYMCSAKRNGYCNDKLDGLLGKARATIDPAERTSLYSQASQIIWDDAVGVFPMDLAVNAAWRTTVTGFAPNPAGLPRFHGVSVAP